MAEKKGYKTGVLWQDFQHGQLIELLNQLQKAKGEDQDEAMFNYTVGFLAMYVNHHFKLEEAYMKTYEFEGQDDHRSAHKKLIQAIKKFREEHREYSEEASEKLINELREWIMSHIMGMDQELGAFIIEQEKSQPEDTEKKDS